MDIFEKFFHIWNLWGPMHLSINVWSWSGKKSESWYFLMQSLERLFWDVLKLKKGKKSILKVLQLNLLFQALAVRTCSEEFCEQLCL